MHVIVRNMVTVYIPIFSAILLFVSYLIAPHAHAASLSYVSDTISDSERNATTTTHTIEFVLANPIPPSGHIELRFESGLIVPAALDYTDVDFQVASATTGPFTDRSLGPVPNAVDDGVSTVAGSGGIINIDLSSGSGLSAGDVVLIKIGNNAVVGATGDQYITSPAVYGMKFISIVTKDASNVKIDDREAAIYFIGSVATGAIVEQFPPPVISNGLPSGLLPGGTTNVLISVNTDIQATCKYATTSNLGFFTVASSSIMTKANLRTLHYVAVPTVDNTIYNFYIRCMNDQQVPTTVDYVINFEVGVPPGTTTPPAPPPPPPTPSGGGGPSGPGGGGGLYLQGGDVTLEGKAAPFSKLTILKDGVIAREIQVTVLGDFSEKFTNLQRGTYTWGAYVTDPKDKHSSTYSSTIYLIAKTNNIIAPVYLSPTITAASSTVGIGESVKLSGYAIALNTVQVIMNRQGAAATGKIVSATTTANGNGSWSMELPTEGLSKGTYEIKAVSLLANNDRSVLGPIIYVGVGENPNPDFTNRADLNKDKKVNLTDFSILLFNWKTADPVADINLDGTVNLVDFSIMLANWTG